MSLKYNCHINLEICTSVKACKYLYKYCFKGHDRCEVEVVVAAPAGASGAPGAPAPADRDEIKEYIDCRYVSSCEACWRLFGFELSNIRPHVVRLAVHLPNGQQVYFQESKLLQLLHGRVLAVGLLFRFPAPLGFCCKPDLTLRVLQGRTWLQWQRALANPS